VDLAGARLTAAGDVGDLDLAVGRAIADSTQPPSLDESWSQRRA
jgi:hypothetical protein